MSRQSILMIGATLVVLIIGVAMFALAGQPMTPEAEIAQAWLAALCDDRTDDLYALSAVPAAMDRAQFEQRVQNYRNSGEIPNPCAGQANINLIRAVPVPVSLREQVAEISFFSEATLLGTDGGQRATIPLWLYHQVDGQWLVWSSFLGPTPETPVAPGEIGALLDTNGLMVGTVQITAPAVVYPAANEVWIGIPLNLQSFTRPWEQYRAQLFVGSRPADTFDQAEQLPEEWRTDFLRSTGGYNPQNLQWSGVMWFRTKTLSDSIVLAFNATVPYSGTLQSTYFTVSIENDPITPFNPFSEGRFVGIYNDNPIFAFHIDTTGLPTGSITIDCSGFVLVTDNDEWKRGTDCTFPNNGGQVFLPDEQMNVQVTFAGYFITETEQVKSVMYRRTSDAQVIRIPLWQAPAGN